jgi:hypothetical protein
MLIKKQTKDILATLGDSSWIDRKDKKQHLELTNWQNESYEGCESE